MEILKLCMHYKLQKWLIIKTLYNNCLYLTRMTLDVIPGGALINKSYDEAYVLIEYTV